jgi:hypothetical protein
MTHTELRNFPEPPTYEWHHTVRDLFGNEKHYFRLTHPYRYTWKKDGVMYRITVPAGLITDKASIPRIIQRTFGFTPDGPIELVTPFHDFGCQKKGMLGLAYEKFRPLGDLGIVGVWEVDHTRWTDEALDRLFFRMMKEVTQIKHPVLFYNAVRFWHKFTGWKV